MSKEGEFVFFEKIQEKLSSLVKIDEFELKEGMLICGLDAAYKNNEGVAVAVIMRLGEKSPVSEIIFQGRALYEYVPGLLYVREAPLLLGALSKLSVKPDLLLVDGHGLAHPRRGGLASIIGVLTDTPSIGIAKRLLIGEVKWENPMIGRLEIAGDYVGIAYKNKKGKIFYASIGHMVDLQTINKIISLFNYDEPLPILLAHKASKRKIKQP
ncbi:MAG: endonuclease V [Nitrososphaerota archaeon]